MPGIGNVARLSSKLDYRNIESALNNLQEWLDSHTHQESVDDAAGLGERLRQLWPALLAANAKMTLWTWRIIPGVGGWADGRWDAQVMRSAQYHDHIESVKRPPEPNWTPEQVRERLTPNQLLAQQTTLLKRLLDDGAGDPVTEAAWIDFSSAVAAYAKELLDSLRPESLKAAPTPKLSVPPPPRLVFQPESYSVTLDGKTYPNIDPNTFEAFKVLHDKTCGGGEQTISSEKLRKLLTKCNHVRTLSRRLNDLPKKLRVCAKALPGKGRWFQLPTL